jgi:uncharacterized Zn finger protein
MSALKIDELLIRQNSTDQSFNRGQEYARSQSVGELIWRDRVLRAYVAGTSRYRVAINFNNQEVQSATCTCPYEFGGWCKHIVAVLLVGMEQPNIEERAGLTQMLERLDLEQTRKLLHNLVAKAPDLIEQIDRQVEILTARNSSKSPQSKVSQATSQLTSQRQQIDRAPFRRQVNSLLQEELHNIECFYSDEPFGETLDQEVEKAKQFIDAGDSFRAFMMLYAIAEGLSEHVDDIAEYCDLSDIVYDIDAAMAEAILWTDFSMDERQKWRVELEGTQDTLCAELNLSLAALEQGWDDLELQSMLRGEQIVLCDEIETDWSSDTFFELGAIRLRILETQERFEEYLNLAKATDYISLYVCMLIQMNRLDEAIAATELIRNEQESFTIAKKLLESGVQKEALQIAKKGLEFQDQDQKKFKSLELAQWTANLAERMGESEICLNAKLVAFKIKPDFGDYRKICDLAKEQWATIKQDLLTYLKTYDGWGGLEAKVDIFLEEKMFDEAIAIANSYLSRNQTKLLIMRAVIEFKPEWVISQAKALAADIINRGKADAYNDAISWLEQVRNGYFVTDNQQEWLTFRTELLSTHGRKRKLMDLLNRKGL